MILCRLYDMATPKEKTLPEEHTLTLYALLNVWEPPRRLSRYICDKDIGEYEECFHCHFQLPLPKQIVIFGLGKWELNFKGCEMVAEVSINTEIPPQKIGVLSCSNKVLCWEEGWTAKFLKKSDELHEQGRMAKLTVKAVKVSFCNDKENMKKKERTVLSPPQQHFDCDIKIPSTPGYFENLKQTKLTFAECGEEEGCPASEKMTPPAKKRRKSIVETPVLSGRRRHSMQDTGRSKGSPRIRPAKSPGTPTAPHTPANMPTGRWGHGMCSIDNRKAVLVGGQGSKLQMVKDSVWTLDMSLGDNIWQQESCEQGGADRRIGHTVTYDPDKKVVYVYGGSKNKRWFSDVNILDLQTNIWSAVKAVGNAPTRAYHSCNLFHGELLVFGGVYPNPDPKPDSCSNELHIFNTDAKNWYKPITTGTPPCHKSGHSASLLGDRLVVFGGWDFPQCFNDVSIIDLAIMEFTSPTTTGLPPSPRTWHAVAVLPEQRIFIHGGYDGNQILKDSFIFELETFTWTQLHPPDHLTARAGHTALHLPSKSNSNEEQKKDQICIFGGGDNAGGFFNNLVVFSPC